MAVNGGDWKKKKMQIRQWVEKAKENGNWGSENRVRVSKVFVKRPKNQVKEAGSKKLTLGNRGKSTLGTGRCL